MYPFILVHGLAAHPRAFMCTHMRRLILKLPVFLNCSPAYCLRKGLSLNLEFTTSARLVGQQVSENCLHIPRFYMDPGDPNSSSPSSWETLDSLRQLSPAPLPPPSGRKIVLQNRSCDALIGDAVEQGSCSEEWGSFGRVHSGRKSRLQAF